MPRENTKGIQGNAHAQEVDIYVRAKYYEKERRSDEWSRMDKGQLAVRWSRLGPPRLFLLLDNRWVGMAHQEHGVTVGFYM
jgi:hypothetical protein